MNLRSFVAKAPWTAAALLTITTLTSHSAQALSEHNVSRGVAIAADQGRVPAQKAQTLTVFLKLHDSAAFDKAVEDIYTPGSPTFHKFFKDEDFEKFAPTKAELETVKKELEQHGLNVVSVNRQNFSVRVRGNTSQVEEAFQTELHTFGYNGRVFQAHVRDAKLTGSAGELIRTVSGLDRSAVRPQVVIASNPHTGKPLYQKSATAITGGQFVASLSGVPLAPPALVTYSTPGAPLPIASYYGNQYDVNPNLIVSYTPKQLQAYYGLSSLIKQGYDGTGQTVALVEGYGYAHAASDANEAATLFGLPQLTSKNFATIYPEGKPLNPNAADLEGWTTEIALDIQSAHAIAPGAKIVVVASAGQDNEDQIASLQYIIDNKIANTVSSSWENDDEIVAGSAEEDAFNAVLEQGAAAGISFQFSSGDGGDLGLGTPKGAVGVPSNSPWATAVGGTSILNDPVNGGYVTTGWGNDVDYVELGSPTDPPSEFNFFYAGAGGGESLYFPKPFYQKSLAGTGREVPDVAALADPFTGFAIIFTIDGQKYYEAGIGGTSLASPIFTATWAIADQYNGAPLGFAAPIAAKLKGASIRDVLPTDSAEVNDVTGTVYDSNGGTFYTAPALFTGSLYSQKQFLSGLWNPVQGEGLVLSFGTDSSLTVKPGYDNVTGYGEPNGLPFLQGVSGKTTGAALAK